MRPLDEERADVVIIGGGGIGASAAYHLTEMGVTDVALVERDVLAAGSTSKSLGGIRLQFGDELNVRITRRSLDAFERFDEVVANGGLDVDIDLRQMGYLILLDSEDDLEVFRGALAMQQSLGVPSREVSVDEVRAMMPALDTEGVLAATYCPLDGRAVPEAVVQGYVSAAAGRGARVRQGRAVTGIRRTESGAICGVETTKGTIHTDTVICAAGVWSKEVAAHVGVALPVEPEVHWVFFSSKEGGVPSDIPFTIDFASGFYLTREHHGMLFGGRAAKIEELVEPAVRRLPLMADIEVESSWWGYYDMSPDHNAIIGAAQEAEGFYFATGFSGHGFQQCPAVGEHLAELIVGREPTLDMSPFGLERFADGAARLEPFYI
ncbi:NAD(P)/FAD-dependent oxidoreductase [Conexibacter woesei]|uniref:FAD dependent oxidoreductase n=1 Tax=Conexibacter woesei (strain DSM 14684 / CCUG 47730 / CIP 108061 / JCM 11494 / NBRC 100937 / ID131577) TaxID=469383 RepID=D3F3L6_CONWI|nr:FAD-binding oxidoreductase [Conexibacter woesei]ADB52381.1 FAD dependent oxidoreductase [Conexibacter woesei DSM 14684]